MSSTTESSRADSPVVTTTDKVEVVDKKVEDSPKKTVDEIPELGWGDPPPTPPGDKSKPRKAKEPSNEQEEDDDQSPADPEHNDEEGESAIGVGEEGDEDSEQHSVNPKRWAPAPAGSRRGRRQARTDVTAQWGLFQPTSSERGGRGGGGRGGGPAGMQNSPRRNAAGSHAFALQQMAKRTENSIRSQLHSGSNQSGASTTATNNNQYPQQAPRHTKQHNMSPGVLSGYAQPQGAPMMSSQYRNNVNNNGYPYQQANGYANNGGQGMSQSQQPQRYRSQNRESPDNTPLSSTNLYIKGLKKETTDQDLTNMCKQYGTIRTTKAIMDKQSNLCKGFGFVDFTTQDAAENAVQGLTDIGLQAQMAKMRPNHVGEQLQFQPALQDQTNLYVANLPPDFEESDLNDLFSKYGVVISTRVLRRDDKTSRCVGFARMESCEVCEEIIRAFNDKPLKEGDPNITVKFADSGKKPKRNPMQQPYGFESFGASYGTNGVSPTVHVDGSGMSQSVMTHNVNAQPITSPTMMHQFTQPNARPVSPITIMNWALHVFQNQPTQAAPGTANASPYMMPAMPYHVNMMPTTAMPPHNTLIPNNTHIIGYPQGLDPQSQMSALSNQLQSLQMEPNVSMAAASGFQSGATLQYLPAQMPYHQPIYTQYMHAAPAHIHPAYMTHIDAQSFMAQQGGLMTAVATNGHGSPPQQQQFDNNGNNSNGVDGNYNQPPPQQQQYMHAGPPPK